MAKPHKLGIASVATWGPRSILETSYKVQASIKKNLHPLTQKDMAVSEWVVTLLSIYQVLL